MPCRPTGHKRPATQRPALSLSFRRSKRTLSNGSRLTDYTSPGKALLPDHSVNIIDGRTRKTGRSAERREQGRGGGGERERERSRRWYHSLRSDYKKDLFHAKQIREVADTFRVEMHHSRRLSGVDYHLYRSGDSMRKYHLVSIWSHWGFACSVLGRRGRLAVHVWLSAFQLHCHTVTT